MGFCSGTAERLAASLAGRTWPRSRVDVPREFASLGVVALGFAIALAGCAANDSGALLIDPGRYAVYKCDDLATRWKVVSAREKELRGLMDRASQTGGGAVVGSLAYRADYDATVSDARLLQRTAAEKNCGLPFQTQSGQSPNNLPQGGQPQDTQFQSDQSIR